MGLTFLTIIQVEANMIFRRQSTGSYMEYANGNTPVDKEESFYWKRNPLNISQSNECETGNIDNGKGRSRGPILQRKNSMTNRSHGSKSLSDAVVAIKNKEVSSTSWYHPDSKNITMTTTQKRKSRKFSDQSLNSHASDEYYDDEELEEDNDLGDSDHSSGDGGDTFRSNVIASVVGDTDLMDGNML